MKAGIQGVLAALLVTAVGAASATTPQSSQQLFVQLRSSGGVTPLAELVCFPDPGQGQNSTFTLVAFSKDIASILRAIHKPVPKALVATSKNKRFILQWVFNHGVRVRKKPAILLAVSGSKGHMWAASYGKVKGKAIKLRVTFATSDRYSRVVLFNGTVAASVYGQCRPVGYDFTK